MRLALGGFVLDKIKGFTIRDSIIDASVRFPRPVEEADSVRPDQANVEEDRITPEFLDPLRGEGLILINLGSVA